MNMSKKYQVVFAAFLLLFAMPALSTVYGSSCGSCGGDSHGHEMKAHNKADMGHHRGYDGKYGKHSGKYEGKHSGKYEGKSSKTVCPVSGKPGKAKYSMDIGSKVVYFCNAACKEEFKERPLHYLKKMRMKEAKHGTAGKSCDWKSKDCSAKKCPVTGKSKSCDWKSKDCSAKKCPVTGKTKSCCGVCK